MHHSRWKRFAFFAIAALILCFVAMEAFARFYLGFGDPPLTIRDPQIEYMFAPSRCYQRYGNRVCYNQWSMRSPPSDHFNLLVLGDSIINGGSPTDQSNLATSLIAAKTGLLVGNVSAGSWGPANVLAYVDRFGWFGASAAAFVFSGHDLTDLPTFPADLGPNFPEHTPPLALWEIVFRYLPRYVPGLLFLQATPQQRPIQDKAERRALGEQAIRTLFSRARSTVPLVCLFYHRERDEAENSKSAQSFRKLAEESGVLFFPIDEAPSDFRDTIEINDSGQRRLQNAIQQHCLPKAG